MTRFIVRLMLRYALPPSIRSVTDPAVRRSWRERERRAAEVVDAGCGRVA